MDKQLIVDLLNTLNEIEVKGYDNLNRLFGVMLTLKNQLNKPEEVEEDGTE